MCAGEIVLIEASDFGKRANSSLGSHVKGCSKRAEGRITGVIAGITSGVMHGGAVITVARTGLSPSESLV